jgi:hypothetical protein
VKKKLEKNKQTGAIDKYPLKKVKGGREGRQRNEREPSIMVECERGRAVTIPRQVERKLRGTERKQKLITIQAKKNAT